MSATAELCSELLSSGSIVCQSLSRNDNYTVAAPRTSLLHLKFLDTPSTLRNRAQALAVLPCVDPGPVRVSKIERDVGPTFSVAMTGPWFIVCSRRCWHCRLWDRRCGFRIFRHHFKPHIRVRVIITHLVGCPTDVRVSITRLRFHRTLSRIRIAFRLGTFTTIHH